jgi:large subunit ribosomal protein L21
VYALVSIAGKQFIAHPEARLRVPFMADAAPGSSLQLEDIVAVRGDSSASWTLGSPRVQGARVTAEVVGHVRTRKVMVFHKKRRKDHRKKNGHRQPYTELRVTGVQSS